MPAELVNEPLICSPTGQVDQSFVAELGAALAVMPSRTASTQDAKAIIKIYAADLAEYPAISVIKMIRAFRRGKQGDGKWMPTPGEIAKAIDMEWHMEETYRKLERKAEETPRRIRIDRDSKQGRAWDEYAKASGNKLIWAGGSYWYFASEWPPGHELMAEDAAE